METMEGNSTFAIKNQPQFNPFGEIGGRAERDPPNTKKEQTLLFKSLFLFFCS